MRGQLLRTKLYNASFAEGAPIQVETLSKKPNYIDDFQEPTKLDTNQFIWKGIFCFQMKGHAFFQVEIIFNNEYILIAVYLLGLT